MAENAKGQKPSNKRDDNPGDQNYRKLRRVFLSQEKPNIRQASFPISEAQNHRKAPSVLDCFKSPAAKCDCGRKTESLVYDEIILNMNNKQVQEKETSVS